MTEAQKRAKAKYFKKQYRQVVIKLNKVTDADLIAYVEGLENMQGEVKRLMRARVDKEIFTNKQINLIREAVNFYINEREEAIAGWSEEADRLEAVAEASDIEQIKRSHTIEASKWRTQIGKASEKVEDMKGLRDYINDEY